MPPLDRVLISMRVGLHVMFAFLLGLGALTAAEAWTLAPAGALGAVYLAGTVWERRRLPAPTPPAARLAWLGVVAALWAVLVLADPAYAWLLFPLTFLIAAALPAAVHAAASLVSTAAAVALVVLAHPGEFAGPGAIIGPVVGATVALGVYHLYRQLVAQARHHRDVAERLTRTQHQLLAAEREAGRLAERARLAREIHDTLAQGLSSIVLVSRAAQASLRDSDTARARDQLATIAEVAAEGLTEARRLVRGQDGEDGQDGPAPGGFAARLRELGEGARRRQAALGKTLEVTVDVDGEVPNPLVEPLFRVAQEGLSNVERHARARRARITVGVWPDAVTLDVFDDGAGIAAPEGFGLRGIRARIAELGGDVTVDSRPGATILAVRVPQ